MNCPYCNSQVPDGAPKCPVCQMQLQPQPVQWQQYACPQPVVQENRSTTSLVLGICSLLTWLLPLIGFPVSITGLVFGIRKRYTAGIVLNVIGLVLTVANSAIGFYMGFTGRL